MLQARSKSCCCLLPCLLNRSFVCLNALCLSSCFVVCYGVFVLFVGLLSKKALRATTYTTPWRHRGARRRGPHRGSGRGLCLCLGAAPAACHRHQRWQHPGEPPETLRPPPGQSPSWLLLVPAPASCLPARPVLPGPHPVCSEVRNKCSPTWLEPFEEIRPTCLGSLEESNQKTWNLKQWAEWGVAGTL